MDKESQHLRHENPREYPFIPFLCPTVQNTDNLRTFPQETQQNCRDTMLSLLNYKHKRPPESAVKKILIPEEMQALTEKEEKEVYAALTQQLKTTAQKLPPKEQMPAEETVNELFKAIDNYIGRHPQKKVLINLLKVPTMAEEQWKELPQNKQVLNLCFNSFYKIWKNDPKWINFQNIPFGITAFAKSNLSLLPASILLALLHHGIDCKGKIDKFEKISLYELLTSPDIVTAPQLIQELNYYFDQGKMYASFLEKPSLKIQLTRTILKEINSYARHHSRELKTMMKLKINERSQPQFSNFKEICRLNDSLKKCDDLEEGISTISKILILLTLYLGPQALLAYMQNKP